jgi:hypothetical protein
MSETPQLYNAGGVSLLDPHTWCAREGYPVGGRTLTGWRHGGTVIRNDGQVFAVRWDCGITTEHPLPEEVARSAAHCQKRIVPAVQGEKDAHMPTIRNLTPHPLTLHTPGGVVTLPPDGPAVRCAPPQSFQDATTGLPCPVYRQGPLGAPVGLPEALPGVFLVVSLPVLMHPSLAGRHDVLAPGTGPTDGALRDSSGAIIGVTRLVGRED